MIGKTVLKLNQATVGAAVQMYIDSQLAPTAPKQRVLSIEQDRSDDTFEVEIQSVDTTPEQAP